VFILHDTQVVKSQLEKNANEIKLMYHGKQVGPFFALLYNNWCKPSASALHQSFFRQILHQFSRRLEHIVLSGIQKTLDEHDAQGIAPEKVQRPVAILCIGGWWGLCSHTPELST